MEFYICFFNNFLLCDCSETCLHNHKFCSSYSISRSYCKVDIRLMTSYHMFHISMWCVDIALHVSFPLIHTGLLQSRILIHILPFFFRISPDGDYLPVLFIDELSFRTKDLAVCMLLYNGHCSMKEDP